MQKSLPSRRIPLHLQNKVDEMIDKLLENEIIELSDSPFNSPLVIVPKKDGSILLCVEFRELNKQTLKEKDHIPNAQEISWSSIFLQILSVSFLSF